MALTSARSERLSPPSATADGLYLHYDECFCDKQPERFHYLSRRERSPSDSDSRYLSSRIYWQCSMSTRITSGHADLDGTEVCNITLRLELAALVEETGFAWKQISQA
ncbi:hypothetical protein AB6A40_001293 [Gnathostoma spinigerum]|uniref:Uncharacterized protein n=1 Tax=Gnathostoma spinigerum TaxID=75299 RepID=A0ABD6EB70_9BILA